jgi:hypothetical protein
MGCGTSIQEPWPAPGPGTAGVENRKSLDCVWFRTPTPSILLRLRYTPLPPPPRSRIPYFIPRPDEGINHFPWRSSSKRTSKLENVQNISKNIWFSVLMFYFQHYAACTENIIRTSDPIPALLLHNPWEVHPSTPFIVWLTHDAI